MQVYRRNLLGNGAESGKGLNLRGGNGAAGGGVDLALLLTGTGSWELLEDEVYYTKLHYVKETTFYADPADW